MKDLTNEQIAQAIEDFGLYPWGKTSLGDAAMIARAAIAMDRALNATADMEHQSVGKPVAWLLTDKKINDIQVGSVQRLIDRARQAHFTDLIIRINGKDERYQADWLKHLVRATPPLNAPADRDVMRQAPNGWKLVPIEPTLDQYNSACRAYSDWQVQCQEEAREHEDERNPSWGYSQPHFTHSDVYRAMLAAVPTPPAEQPPKELDGIDLVDDLCFAIEARAAGQSGSHRIAELKAELIRRLQRCADEPRAEQQEAQEPVAWATRSDPSLSELRAAVAALPAHGPAGNILNKDAVLAEIDKLGGGV